MMAVSFQGRQWLALRLKRRKKSDGSLSPCCAPPGMAIPDPTQESYGVLFSLSLMSLYARDTDDPHDSIHVHNRYAHDPLPSDHHTLALETPPDISTNMTICFLQMTAKSCPVDTPILESAEQALIRHDLTGAPGPTALPDSRAAPRLLIGGSHCKAPACAR